MLASVSIENNVASISGTLDHSSVPQVLKQLSRAEFREIDLKKIEHSNSAGVALLLELVEQAKQAGKPVTIANLPVQMLRVAKLSGVADLL